MTAALRLDNKGTAAGDVSAAQCSGVGYNRAVITLTDVAVTVANTKGVSYGGTQVFTLPAGINRLMTAVLTGVTFNLSSSGNATPIAGTHGGDLAIGTNAPSDGTLTAGDANIIPSTSIDPISAGVAGAHLSADVLLTGAQAMYLNVLVDAADVADGASDVLLVSGTLTITWIDGGNY